MENSVRRRYGDDAVSPLVAKPDWPIGSSRKFRPSRLSVESTDNTILRHGIPDDTNTLHTSALNSLVRQPASVNPRSSVGYPRGLFASVTEEDIPESAYRDQTPVGRRKRPHSPSSDERDGAPTATSSNRGWVLSALSKLPLVGSLISPHGNHETSSKSFYEKSRSAATVEPCQEGSDFSHGITETVPSLKIRHIRSELGDQQQQQLNLRTSITSSQFGSSIPLAAPFRQFQSQQAFPVSRRPSVYGGQTKSTVANGSNIKSPAFQYQEALTPPPTAIISAKTTPAASSQLDTLYDRHSQPTSSLMRTQQPFGTSAKVNVDDVLPHYADSDEEAKDLMHVLQLRKKYGLLSNLSSSPIPVSKKPKTGPAVTTATPWDPFSCVMPVIYNPLDSRCQSQPAILPSSEKTSGVINPFTFGLHGRGSSQLSAATCLRQRRGLRSSDYRKLLRQTKFHPCKWIDYFEYSKASEADREDRRFFSKPKELSLVNNIPESPKTHPQGSGFNDNNDARGSAKRHGGQLGGVFRTGVTSSENETPLSSTALSPPHKPTIEHQHKPPLQQNGFLSLDAKQEMASLKVPGVSDVLNGSKMLKVTKDQDLIEKSVNEEDEDKAIKGILVRLRLQKAYAISPAGLDEKKKKKKMNDAKNKPSINSTQPAKATTEATAAAAVPWWLENVGKPIQVPIEEDGVFADETKDEESTNQPTQEEKPKPILKSSTPTTSEEKTTFSFSSAFPKTKEGNLLSASVAPSPAPFIFGTALPKKGSTTSDSTVGSKLFSGMRQEAQPSSEKPLSLFGSNQTTLSSSSETNKPSDSEKVPNTPVPLFSSTKEQQSLFEDAQKKQSTPFSTSLFGKPSTSGSATPSSLFNGTSKLAATTFQQNVTNSVKPGLFSCNETEAVTTAAPSSLFGKTSPTLTSKSPEKSSAAPISLFETPDAITPSFKPPLDGKNKTLLSNDEPKSSSLSQPTSAPSSSLFGIPSSTTSLGASPSPLFGNAISSKDTTSATTSEPPSLFKSTTGSALFGVPSGTKSLNQQQSSTVPPISLFGSSAMGGTLASQPAPSGSLFGAFKPAAESREKTAPPSLSSTGTGLFGSSTLGTGSLFGSGSTTQGGATPGTSGLFGSTTATPTQFGSSLSGAPPVTTSLFGNPPATTVTANETMAESKPLASSTGGLFASSTTFGEQQSATIPNTTPPLSLFGTNQQKPSTSLFGAPPGAQEQPSLFGTPSPQQPTTTSLFGTVPATQQSSSLFDMKPPPSSSQTSLLGGTSQSQDGRNPFAANVAGLASTSAHPRRPFLRLKRTM